MKCSGKLPTTKGSTRYILTTVKHLTSWLIFRAIRSQTSDMALRFFEQGVRAQFGAPTAVISDNGPAFTTIGWKRALYDAN